jgi:Ca2+/Na+ antiporter
MLNIGSGLPKKKILDVGPGMDDLDPSHSSFLSWCLGTLHCTGFAQCRGGKIPLAVDNILVAMIAGLSVWQTAKVGSSHLTIALLQISRSHNISKQVSSATLIASATSLPVFVTTLIMTCIFASDAGLSVVVGTCVYNLLVCIGLTGVLYWKIIDGVSLKSYARDSIFYIIATSLLFVFLLDERITILESLVLIVLYPVYCLATYLLDRVEDWILTIKRRRVI